MRKSRFTEDQLVKIHRGESHFLIIRGPTNPGRSCELGNRLLRTFISSSELLVGHTVTGEQVDHLFSHSCFLLQISILENFVAPLYLQEMLTDLSKAS
jgi:hypothetical protein